MVPVILILLKVSLNKQMKIIMIISILWILYKISEFISNLFISNNINKRKENLNQKSGMDIKDADFEEIE